MATIKEALAASAAIAITLDSLTSSSTVGRSSAVVDNSANLYLDALVEVKLVIPSGTPANDKAVYVWAYDSVDGSNYAEAVAGTDSSYTVDNPTLLPLLGVIPFTATGGVTRRSRAMSVASAFGGVLPAKWGIVVVNFTGLTLSTGCAAIYSGLTATVV